VFHNAPATKLLTHTAQIHTLHTACSHTHTHSLTQTHICTLRVQAFNERAAAGDFLELITREPDQSFMALVKARVLEVCMCVWGGGKGGLVGTEPDNYHVCMHLVYNVIHNRGRPVARLFGWLHTSGLAHLPKFCHRSFCYLTLLQVRHSCSSLFCLCLNS